MRWPNHQAYNEALENSSTVFADRELQESVPQISPLGVPKPYSGKFASVYRLKGRERDIAVKCFRRRYPNQEERYARLSDYLNERRLKWFVGFEYIHPNGIRVLDDWYPVVKMDWVDGDFLDKFVLENIERSDRLLRICHAWLEMCDGLNEHRIAHGDFQHKNIIVAGDGNLRLIDYDGMYVESLSGLASAETGVSGYQHPDRGNQFGLYLDHFSAWLVYLTVYSLSVEPDLHERFGGPETLLFKPDDLKSPAGSVLFAHLMRHPDSLVRCMATDLESFLSKDLKDVTPLTRSNVAALDSDLVDRLLGPVEATTSDESEREIDFSVDDPISEETGNEEGEPAIAGIEIDKLTIAGDDMTAATIQKADATASGVSEAVPEEIGEPLQIKILKDDRPEVASADGHKSKAKGNLGARTLHNQPTWIFLTLTVVTCGVYTYLWYLSLYEMVEEYRDSERYLDDARKWTPGNVRQTLGDFYTVCLGYGLRKPFPLERSGWLLLTLIPLSVLSALLLQPHLAIVFSASLAFFLRPLQRASLEVARLGAERDSS